MDFKADITTRVATGLNRTFTREPTRTRPCLIQYSGDALGRRYFLDETEVSIGRAPTNGIVIADGGVSRVHAKCICFGDTLEVEDLGSRNGTFINDRRLHARTTLRDGDIVRLGTVMLKFFARNNFENAFHDKIYRMATIDPGTEVFNRSYLLETLDAEFKFSRLQNRPLSLIYYDLDFFKKVNDAHGHSCGDYVLRESAQVAKSCVRKEDVIGRYGGEEFVVVLPVADAPVATELAERIRKAIAEHAFVFEGKILNQTVSIGVSENRPAFQTYQALLDDADRKLYQSKNAGRNRVTT
jgi:diguanylate cyclase (GGDEF)-like protein